MAVADTDFTGLQAQVAALGEQIQKLATDGTKSGPQQADRLALSRAGMQNELRAINREAQYYPHWKPIDFEKTAYDWGALGGKERKALVAGIADEGIRKAVDSVAVGPLIRQDLDPMIYEIYVKNFPAFDTIEKVEANGLVHAWNQETAYTALGGPGTSGSTFIPELGTVQDDASVYNRLTANIAVNAARRGISLKAKFAVRAGGMGYDPAVREIEGGIRNIAHTSQIGIFRLQEALVGSTTAADPNGLYDANAFNGLRYYLQNIAPAGNTIPVDITASWPSQTTQLIADGLDAAAVAVRDAGGSPTAVWTSLTGIRNLRREQIPFERVVKADRTEIIPGVMVPTVIAGDELLPLLGVPGDSVGFYTISGHNYYDMYVVDTNQLQWAWLGGPSPTVLTIPVGTDGTLRELYIPFMMGALVALAPQFLARVQVKYT